MNGRTSEARRERGRRGAVQTALAVAICLASAATALASEAAPRNVTAVIGPLQEFDLGPGRPTLRFMGMDAAATFFPRPRPVTAPAASPAVFRDYAQADEPEGLLSRMESEARRYRSGHAYDLATAPDPYDSVGEALRAEEAERIVTRAFNRTLDSRLDALARSSDRLAAALSHLEDLGSSLGPHRRREEQGLPDPAALSSVPSGRQAHATVGLRLGAHPALSLRGGFLGVRGRLDLPLLGEPLRLSLERSLGTRGRAALTAGADRDGRDWASLSLGFSF